MRLCWQRFLWIENTPDELIGLPDVAKEARLGHMNSYAIQAGMNVMLDE